jgi:hypothetical protein
VVELQDFPQRNWYYTLNFNEHSEVYDNAGDVIRVPNPSRTCQLS